ncbi:unnamed protein product [Urochloa humidicola]
MEQDAQEVLVHPAQPPVGNDFLELNDLLQHQEQVIAEDINEDDEQLGDILAAVQGNPEVKVQIHLPVVQENFLVEEFPEDMLMDEPAQGEQPPHPEPKPDDIVHLGMVQTFSFYSADPSWEQFVSNQQTAIQKTNAAATRLWAKHFATPGHDTQQADISPSWADFFTLLLVSPSHFKWAKDLITSQAWSFFLTNEKIQFNIPQNYPKDQAAIHFLEHAIKSPLREPWQQEAQDPREIQQSSGHVESPTITPRPSAADKKGKAPQAIVDTEVRRSPRMKKLKKGYRNAACSERACLGCEVSPPLISPAVIRNLGTAFCKLEADKLTANALRTKRKAGTIKRLEGCSAKIIENLKDNTKKTAPVKKLVKPKKSDVPNDSTTKDQNKKPRQQ